ncbi:MAG: DUF4430 domain-containing protein [Oscillospiraceae bacterium]|nr:DUF4430 domain-containing protein [Oscillospiraceae bacterium]
MKNKKILIAVIALVAVAALMVGVYFATREKPVEGQKTITVTVVHKDGSEKLFTCKTTEEYLGPVLLAEKIVEGDMGDYGLFITAADGETADYSVDGGWWAVYKGEEQTTTGADQVVIEDGDSFRLVYTIG